MEPLTLGFCFGGAGEILFSMKIQLEIVKTLDLDKITAEEIGEDHVATSTQTPLRENAFDKCFTGYRIFRRYVYT